MSPNYSLYAIPAYWLLSMVPQVYAVSLITTSTQSWNNANPRSTAYLEKLKQKCTPNDLGRYERAKASHYNSMESFPLDTATLVIGNLAGISVDRMNLVAAALVALRALYILLYINITSVRTSYLRTAVWILSRGICLAILVQAAGNVSADDKGLFARYFGK